MSYSKKKLEYKKIISKKIEWKYFFLNFKTLEIKLLNNNAFKILKICNINKNSRVFKFKKKNMKCQIFFSKILIFYILLIIFIILKIFIFNKNCTDFKFNFFILNILNFVRWFSMWLDPNRINCDYIEDSNIPVSNLF